MKFLNLRRQIIFISIESENFNAKFDVNVINVPGVLNVRQKRTLIKTLYFHFFPGTSNVLGPNKPKVKYPQKRLMVPTTERKFTDGERQLKSDFRREMIQKI